MRQRARVAELERVLLAHPGSTLRQLVGAHADLARKILAKDVPTWWAGNHEVMEGIMDMPALAVALRLKRELGTLTEQLEGLQRDRDKALCQEAKRRYLGKGTGPLYKTLKKA